MGHQKILNLLNEANHSNVINNNSKVNYGVGNGYL